MSFKLLLTAASADANVTAAVIIFWFLRSSVVWVESEGGVRTDPPRRSLADKRGDLHIALILSYGGLSVRAVLTRTGEREERDICARIGKYPHRSSLLKLQIFLL